MTKHVRNVSLLVSVLERNCLGHSDFLLPVLCRHHFGTSHPLYIKALLHFCHFSSEFKQDKQGLQIAKVGLFNCLILLYHWK